MMKITKSQLKEMVKEVLKEQATLPPPKNPAQSFKIPVSKSGSIEITDGENLTSNEKSALDKMSTTLINNVATKKSALKLLTILQKSIEEGFFDKKLKESNGASKTVSESKNIPHYKEFEKKFEKLTKQDIENIAKSYRINLRAEEYRLALYYSDLLYSSNNLALELDDPTNLYETIEALLSAPPVVSIYGTPKWDRVSRVVEKFDRKFGGHDNAKAIDEYAKHLGEDLLQLVNKLSNK